MQLGVLSLLSAFLLFQVQPVISKFILPWFGGSPGVWATCMLFFQVALFLGYAYAHGLTRLSRRQQWTIHGLLVLAAVACLPIAPSAQWKPSGMENPAGRILTLLLSSVGLPYFVLASTSPMVQVWFSRTASSRSPWRLYALSNLGSLAALLSYPFFFEPRWDVMQQTWMWSGGFVAFAVLSLLRVHADWRSHATVAAYAAPVRASRVPGWWHRLRWLALPAVASVLLLAATNHLCQDVAVIPFLWVVPLSLYLITFIICFERERWYARWFWIPPALVLLTAAAAPDALASGVSSLLTKLLSHEVKWEITPDFRWEIALASGAMFLGCMVCHGELARLKPDPAHLTDFYLVMSAGGALGGLFVALGAPSMFTTYLEWPGALTTVLVIGSFALLHAAWSLRRRWARVALSCLTVAQAAFALSFLVREAFPVSPALERVRNFYGAISVEQGYDERGALVRALYHGKIAHGCQYLTKTWRNQPLSYYGKHTGVGRALLTLRTRSDARVGVVGMGTATAASYGLRGHTYRFYEINPEMVRLARSRFYFLDDLEERGGTVEVALGDARRSLEKDDPQQFDVLLLDAFSGDSVPVHLLTREAFEIYKRHMKTDGIIAVHLSNRYLSLAPVVGKVAASLGWKTTLMETSFSGFHEATSYVMVTNNESFLERNPSSQEDWSTKIPVSLWTDRDHNLFEVLIR